jgi:hypothetical protein
MTTDKKTIVGYADDKFKRRVAKFCGENNMTESQAVVFGLTALMEYEGNPFNRIIGLKGSQYWESKVKNLVKEAIKENGTQPG